MPTATVLLSCHFLNTCERSNVNNGAKPLTNKLQGPLMSANPCMTFRAFVQLSPCSDVACAGRNLRKSRISKCLCTSAQSSLFLSVCAPLSISELLRTGFALKSVGQRPLTFLHLKWLLVISKIILQMVQFSCYKFLSRRLHLFSSLMKNSQEAVILRSTFLVLKSVYSMFAWSAHKFKEARSINRIAGFLDALQYNYSYSPLWLFVCVA